MKFVRKIFLIYLLSELLGGYVGFLSGPDTKAFAQVSQSITISTVAPPSNAPLLTSGLNCVTGTGGAFSAGQLVVGYTYAGTTAASESRVSADGGTTLTTVVTCPASGVLTVPSPPSPPGCANCVGWRPYAIASSSGTGAELLQTITAANCTLATTSGLTACAIGSSFTETTLGAGAAVPTNPTLFTPAVAAFPPFAAGTGGSHTLNWVVTGTAATCTVQLETSATQGGAFTLMTGTTAQTCTTSGSMTINGQTANFVRINPTAFTATGANVPSIVFTYAVTGSALPVTVASYSCGSTTGTVACGNAQQAGQPHVLWGIATLAANTATISGIVPAFTSSTSWTCTANDVTTRANPVQAIPSSGTALVITNTTGATDVIQYICVGN